MRDLNEIKAEVLLRSEKIIKQKKKSRKMFISFCVPLCLFMLIGTAMLVAPLIKDSNSVCDEGTITESDMNNASNQNDGADGIYNNGTPIILPDIEMPLSDVTVSVIKYTNGGDGKTICVIMDPDEAAELSDGLFALLNADDLNTTTEDYVGTKDLTYYLIKYTDEHGVTTTYKLQGNLLFGEDGQSVMLGEEEEKRLYSSFGIG